METELQTAEPDVDTSIVLLPETTDPTDPTNTVYCSCECW